MSTYHLQKTAIKTKEFCEIPKEVFSSTENYRVGNMESLFTANLFYSSSFDGNR